MQRKDRNLLLIRARKCQLCLPPTMASPASFHMHPNFPGNQVPAHCSSERLGYLSKVTQPELAEVGCKPGVPGPKTQEMMLLWLIIAMAVGLLLG